jgi:hypothetical protein
MINREFTAETRAAMSARQIAAKQPRACPRCSKVILANKGPFKTHMKFCGRDLKADFWAKAEPLPWSGCWIWMGAEHYRGYGACGTIYGDCRAHRVAWKMTNGDIPKGMGVLHKCHNPLCVNPEHLYLGDQKQNMADAVAAGRKHHRYTPVDQLLHPQLSKRLTGRKW